MERSVLGLKVVCDSKAAGVRFKGPASDAINECSGTEQRIVFVASNDSYIEPIECIPAGKPLVGNSTTDIGSSRVRFNTEDTRAFHEKLLRDNVQLHCSPQDVGFGQALYFSDRFLLSGMGKAFYEQYFRNDPTSPAEDRPRCPVGFLCSSVGQRPWEDSGLSRKRP